jgi:MFS family permease
MPELERCKIERSSNMTETLSLAQESGTTRGVPTHVLRIRKFRMFWIGESISLLGDQFYMIALPWLALTLTGNALAVGTVFATAGIPRALFMLVDGALTDRFTPRRLMMNSNIARMILTGLLAALAMTDLIQLWMLYALAFLFGLADAFFFPAQTSIVRQLVSQDQLQQGNAIIQGTAQLSLLVGPLVAGVTISLLDRGTPYSTSGMALAFALDSLSFIASITMLGLVRIKQANTRVERMESGIFVSIREGLLYVWNDATLKVVFPIVMGLNILINGPFAVGIPVVTRTRFSEGAAAFGLILSVFDGGALLGTVLAGVLPRPSNKKLGTVSLSILSLMGVRLAAIGLNPLSTALAGALIGLNIGILLINAGSLMTLFTLSAEFSPAICNGMESS